MSCNWHFPNITLCPGLLLMNRTCITAMTVLILPNYMVSRFIHTCRTPSLRRIFWIDRATIVGNTVMSKRKNTLSKWIWATNRCANYIIQDNKKKIDLIFGSLYIYNKNQVENRNYYELVRKCTFRNHRSIVVRKMGLVYLICVG